MVVMKTPNESSAAPSPPAITRRGFLHRSGIAATGSALGLSSSLRLSAVAAAEEAKKKQVAKPESETLVQQLFASLSPEQMEAVVFPFNDPERQRVENNWHITKQTVGGFFKADQQAMIRGIFGGLHSEEYREKVYRQFAHDNMNQRNKTADAAFGSASVALFGAPGTGQFEFVFTGRHCTRRCDGDSVEGAAFGGPIFYGHQAGDDFDEAPDHPGNVYWFQAQRANEVFAMLDGKQRRQALKDKPRPERGTATVELKGNAEGLDGVGVADMSADQKGKVKEVLNDLLAPFREVDRKESMKYIEPQLEQLRIAFYQSHDVGDDKVWDTWQIEGPSMIWHFRGDPHVHTWVNIRKPAASEAAGA
jgi:hypothetical protein